LRRAELEKESGGGRRWEGASTARRSNPERMELPEWMKPRAKLERSGLQSSGLWSAQLSVPVCLAPAAANGWNDTRYRMTPGNNGMSEQRHVGAKARQIYQ